MTTHQLLTSGFLEAHLLGLTSDEEQRSVEKLLAASPELAAFLTGPDTTLTSHFLHHSVPPPPAIREVIELRAVEQELQKRERGHTNYSQKATRNDPASGPNYVDVEVDNTYIRVHKNWRPAFIAVFILSKVFLIASVYYYFKADSQTQEINRLKAQIAQAK